MTTIPNKGLPVPTSHCLDTALLYVPFLPRPCLLGGTVGVRLHNNDKDVPMRFLSDAVDVLACLCFRAVKVAAICSKDFRMWRQGVN